MKHNVTRLAYQVASGLALVCAGASFSGCGGGDDATARQRTSGNDADAAGKGEETRLSATVVDANGESEGLALSEASIDYKITVRCTFGGQAVEKIYTAAQFAAQGATMPKGSSGCYAFPSEIRLGPAPETVFVPPAPALGPTSFGSYTSGAVLIYVQSPAPTSGPTSEAIVRLDNPLPRVLSGDSAALAYDVDFRVRQAVIGVTSNVTLDQSKLTGTIKGQNAPALSVEVANFLTIAASQPAAKAECDYMARVTCSKNPVAGADGKLKSCDGVDLKDLKYEFAQPGTTSALRALNANDVIKTATGASLPITIACDRTGGTANQARTGLVLRVFNFADAANGARSSIAFPFNLTINYSAFP